MALWFSELKRGTGELGDWVIPLILLWLLENWWKIVFCENLPTLTVTAVSTVILSTTAEKSCIHKSRLKINTFGHGWYSLTLLGTNFSLIVVVGVCWCTIWEQKFWPALPGCPQATIPSPKPLEIFFKRCFPRILPIVNRPKYFVADPFQIVDQVVSVKKMNFNAFTCQLYWIFPWLQMSPTWRWKTSSSPPGCPSSPPPRPPPSPGSRKY